MAFTKEKLTPELAPPPELAELEEHVEAAKAGEEVDVMTTGKLIYAVMCEQVMLYDQDQEGMLTKTSIDYDDKASFEDDIIFKNRVCRGPRREYAPSPSSAFQRFQLLHTYIILHDPRLLVLFPHPLDSLASLPTRRSSNTSTIMASRC